VGDAKRAVTLLESLLDSQPDAVLLHYPLAVAYQQLGDNEQAARHRERVPVDNLDQTALALDDPWARELRRMDRGASGLTRRGTRAFRRGDSQAAAVLLGSAVTADPTGPEKRINYGIALREIGRLPAAIDQLRQALALAAPESELAARAHLELARTLARDLTLEPNQAGRAHEIRSHLESTLAIDPRSLAAHLELARLDHFEGDLAAAFEHYSVARQLDPGLVATSFWQAAVASLLDRRATAIELLTSDLEVFEGDRTLTLLLARLLAASNEPGLRDVERAEELLQGVSSEDPDVLYAETAAMVAAESRRYDEAVRWQQAVVDALAEARPRSAVHRARRRLVLYQQGDPCRSPWELLETPLLLALGPGAGGT
jgi:tetratricopeptide (TPR) repeat protein